MTPAPGSNPQAAQQYLRTKVLTATPEQLFARKYMGGGEYVPDGRHAWLQLTPDKLVSWDFRKLAALSR